MTSQPVDHAHIDSCIVIGCDLVQPRRKMNTSISGRSHIAVAVVNTATDRQTDRQTQADSIYGASVASRGKKARDALTRKQTALIDAASCGRCGRRQLQSCTRKQCSPTNMATCGKLVPTFLYGQNMDVIRRAVMASLFSPTL